MIEYQRPDLFIQVDEDPSTWPPFGNKSYSPLSHIDHYIGYCKEHGLPIHDVLFV